MKSYPLQLEISGPTALWTRPDTLPYPVSYVAPTRSAVKGILESVLRWRSVEVRPLRCEICAPVQFHGYAFNYGGPLRKSDQVKKGDSLRIFAQVLVNVRYRLHAEAVWARGANGEPAISPDGACSPHAYVETFERRCSRGRWFYTPCLGWKEFAPDYVGVFRSDTTVCGSENHTIPALLVSLFDQPQNGSVRPRFERAQVVDGVLEYA